MNISLKKFSKKSLSLLIALIMVFSALPLTPSISANAETTYTRTGYYDFTSDYVVGTTGSNAVSGYTGGNFKAYFKAWDRTGCVKSGTRSAELMSGKADDLYNLYTSVLSVKSGTESQFYYNGTASGNLQRVTPNIDGLYFRDGFFYLPNIGSYLGQTGFRISWTEQYYSKSSDSGAGVFSLGTGTNGDIVKWTTNDNSFYVGGSNVQSNSTPTSGHVYEITLSAGTDNLLNVSVYDRTSAQQIINYTSSTAYDPSTFNYLVIGSCNQASDKLGTFVLSNLTIEKGEQTTGGGSEPTAPTNKTIDVIGYGILKKTNESSRANNNVLGIVNDQQDAYFDIGFVNFDISSLSNSEFNVASAIYNMTYSMASSGREAMGLSFYYATRNNAAFNRTDKPANFTNTTYDSNIYGANNQHIARATSYLGLVNIGSVDTATNTTNASIPIDIAPAIRYALSKGETRVQLLIMLKEAGGSGGLPWTDTNVTVPTTPVSVTMQTKADYVKANINVEGKVNKNYSNIVENNAGAYTGNVIVADQWTASQNNTNYLEANQKASDNLRFYAYNNAVALYTGAGNVRFPIVLEKVAVSNPSGYDVYQNIEYTALNNGGLFSLGNDKDQWQYCNSATDLTDATSGNGEGQVVTNFSNSTSASKDSYKANGSNINYAKNDKFGTTTTKAFKNYIKYTGSGNSDTYYDKLSTPTFSYRADYAVFWKDGRYWALTSVDDKAFTLNSDFNCYVLNYKPLYDIVSNASFKNNYNEISQNSSKYSQEGLNNYYAVVADIIDFNLANESMTSESEVRAVAGKIKDLVTRYNSYKTPELKQYTVTFNDLLGTVTLKTLKVTPGTTINESDLPKLTTPKYYQNNQHYIYYWKNSDDTEFTVPYTVNDNVAISESRKIENCNFEVKSISGNTSTVSCSVCNGGTYTLDIEAYNHTVSVAREAINDTAKYDSASRANLETVLNNNNTVNDCITKEQIDAKISAIQTAITALVPEKYSVTLHYYDSTGTPLYSESGNIKEIVSDIPYGKLQTISVSGKFNENYVVYKWTRDVDGQNKISGLNSDTLDVVVKENANYYVFLKNTSVDESQASGKAVVTINNKSNKIFDIGYIDLNENTPVSVSKNTITIGTVTLTAPNYSFYNITGFNINGKIITGTDTVSITKDTVIRPVYEAKQTVRITRASAGILINGNDDDSVDVEWNKKIVMTYNGAVPDGKVVIWKDGNGNVLAQGSTYSFYANSNVTISATVEASAPAVPTASIGMFSYDATDNKVTVVNNFYVPDGMKATKAGVILSTKNSTVDALKKQTNGIFKGGPESFTSTGNQIRISVSRTANTSFTMYALAYVVVGDKTYYAPTVQSITYTVTNS